MRHQPTHESGKSKQRGVVLFVALILLLILSMIGVTVARMQTVEERMARNEHNRQLAAQAAEAALHNAENQLVNPPGVPKFAANTGGYYTVSQTAGSVLPTLDWTDATKFVYYNGPVLSAGSVALPTPKIVIEYMGTVAMPGEDVTNPPSTYRVTVQGMNAEGNPSSILQSIYR